MTLTRSGCTFVSVTIPLFWSRINVLETSVFDIRGKYSGVEYEGIVTIDRANKKTTSFYVSNNDLLIHIWYKI